MDWTKPEPPPQQTGSAAVWLMVINDLGLVHGRPYPPLFLRRSSLDAMLHACLQRHEFGMAKHKVPLEVHNGRDPLNDLRDEALDAVAYSRQNYERTKTKEDWELHLLAVQFAARVIQRILKERR